MQKSILIIEDEPSIQNIIKAFLMEAGYLVYTANDGVTGINAFLEFHPDLVLLDLMLPKIDGFAVCEILRKESNTPIIMLTALDDESSQLKGFELFTDDYITKPFSMPLVMKRIEAVLRRYEKTESESNVLVNNGICLNKVTYEVFADGKPITLTAREFEILKLFMENPGRVYTRDHLVNLIWNYDFTGDDRIINTHIKNIRKKLGVPCIETIRGVGYKFVS